MSEPDRARPQPAGTARGVTSSRERQRSSTHRERPSSGKSAVPTNALIPGRIETRERVIPTGVAGAVMKPREGGVEGTCAHPEKEEASSDGHTRTRRRRARRGRQPPESEPRSRETPGTPTTRGKRTAASPARGGRTRGSQHAAHRVPTPQETWKSVL